MKLLLQKPLNLNYDFGSGCSIYEEKTINVTIYPFEMLLDALDYQG